MRVLTRDWFNGIVGETLIYLRREIRHINSSIICHKVIMVHLNAQRMCSWEGGAALSAQTVIRIAIVSRTEAHGKDAPETHR